MRTSINLPFFSLLILLLTTFSAAWPWPRWLPARDSLIARQDNNDQTSGSASASPTRPASGSATATASQSDDNKSESGSPTATSGSGSRTGSQTGSITSKPTDSKDSKSSSQGPITKSTYDVSYAAGGVNLQTPAIIDGSQFFKVSDYVTFVWNLTSLQATPTALNIVASCTANQATYTIAANHTVDSNGTGKVVWDTKAYQDSANSQPLLTNQYKLIIYDADSTIDATAQPGYLQVFNQYTFGMYTKRPYVDFPEWKCATCSAALGSSEKRALGLMLGMSALTIMSFSWFINGLDVIW